MKILLRPDKRNLDVKHGLSYVTVVNNFRMFLCWKSRLLKLAFISHFWFWLSCVFNLKTKGCSKYLINTMISSGEHFLSAKLQPRFLIIMLSFQLSHPKDKSLKGPKLQRLSLYPLILCVSFQKIWNDDFKLSNTCDEISNVMKPTYLFLV